jgi:stalled ribosome rescue protein Dom34
MSENLQPVERPDALGGIAALIRYKMAKQERK